nr:MAG TPA: hypothetical protein [Caudoviricetes sp.]
MAALLAAIPPKILPTAPMPAPIRLAIGNAISLLLNALYVICRAI